MSDPFAVPVRDCMSPGLVSVRPTTPLTEVLRTLERRNVSCVAVTDDGDEPLGVVSSTDLARVAKFDPSIAGMPMQLPSTHTARDLMRSPLITVDENDTVHAAADRMIRSRIHRVFVTAAGKVVGVLSTRDVMRTVLAARLTTPLSTVMTVPVETVGLGESIETALAQLDKSDVRGLVVVDGKKPVGVFTQSEAIKARALPRELRTQPVERAMSYETLCLDSSTPLYRVAGHAIAMQVRRILVTEDGALVGVVTGYDLARVATLQTGAGSQP